ncbi:MAG: TIGR04283 family arsenosugar biosynthesis glycosyltransferase [Methylovulum sp.]|nr:TIGR04283 family arsenosugar biosynthesis glycosyltransferase [Methylovulum sp.]
MRRFSIIIPTLDEAGGIVACLSALQPLRGQCELIMVDGGSTDATTTLAAPWLDKLLVAGPGRAKQMNCGAAQATGEILVFLHADTYLPANVLPLIATSLEKGRYWGRFDVVLSGGHFMLKVIAVMMNWRSRLTGIATGDQVIFVTRKAFMDVGGYPEIPLMEDIALSKALNKLGKPVCLAAKVTSSGRRWLRYGILHTILLMWWLRWRFACGDQPERLAVLYARGRLWNL